MSADISFDRISGSLGSLLLLWASIEDEARRQILTLSGDLPKSVHGIAAALRAWEQAVASTAAPGLLAASLAAALRHRLQPALEIRNGVCHGLAGISATRDEAPAALTWRTGDGVRSMPLDDLQAMFQQLSRVPRAIAMISTSTGRPGDRLVDTPDNREWWSTEFRLEPLGG